MPRKKKVRSVAEEVLAADAAQTPPPEKKTAIPRRARAELQKLSTDGDLVDIWERRLLNPNHTESQSIRIKTPGMRLRWINLSNRGRFQRARYEQGWVPVTKTELEDEREIYGATYTTEGYVCRGEKQGEMLMKIPQAVYRKIMERRADLNKKSYKNLKDNIAQAGHGYVKERSGGDAGDMAADVVANFKGDIKFGTERASSDELFD